MVQERFAAEVTRTAGIVSARMPRSRHRERRAASAFHEAAHAIVGYMLGWRIEWARTYWPGAAGRTGFDGGVKMAPPSRPTLAHRSAVRLAGEIAEMLFTGRSAPQIRSDSADDWQQLWAVDLSRSHIALRQKRRVVDQGRDIARSLLRSNTERFLRLAAAISRGPVTAREALKIIADGRPEQKRRYG